MTRFATLTAVLALAAAPVVADTATQSITQNSAESQSTTPPSAENYEEGPISPDFSYYGTSTLMGSDVYTTNRGRQVLDVEGLDMASVSKIGNVSDVLLTNAGTLRGIVVHPIETKDDLHWYFPATEVITVNDDEGPRYMVSYTVDEMNDIEKVPEPNSRR